MSTNNFVQMGNTKVIDRSSILPYYFQLKEFLLEQIKSGNWESGQQLPSEADFCQTFGVSRTVVRQALQELVSKGILYRQKGKGTFIAERKIPQTVSFLQGFDQKMRTMGHKTRTEVLQTSAVPASQHIRQCLGLRPDEQVFKVIRLRYVDGEPMVLQTVCLRKSLFPNLLDEDLSTSLTTLIREKYGLRLTAYNVSMEPVLATGFEAEVLHVKQGGSLMLIEGVSIAAENQRIRYTKGVYRADRLQFIVEGYTIKKKIESPDTRPY